MATGTYTTLESSEPLFVLGETLRPLLTNAMGSAIEVFDTSGPCDVVHVPADVAHGYRNVSDAHFLTIATRGNASAFFGGASETFRNDPNDFAGLVALAERLGVQNVA